MSDAVQAANRRLAEGKITVEEHARIIAALSIKGPPNSEPRSPADGSKPQSPIGVYGLWAAGLVAVVIGLMGLYGAWMLRNFCVGFNCRPDPNYLTPAVIGAIGAYLIYLAEKKRKRRV